MPSYNLDLRDPQSVLRILVCLVEAAKGKELQIWAQDYDGLNTGKLLTVDYQRKRGIISLRVTSDNGAAIPVAPEAHQWTRPPEAAPTERHRVAAARSSEEEPRPNGRGHGARGRGSAEEAGTCRERWTKGRPRSASGQSSRRKDSARNSHGYGPGV